MLRKLLIATPMVPLITILFVIVNGILFLKLGVSVDGESGRYLGYAQDIGKQGFFFKPHEIWYIGYVFFIIVVTAIYPAAGAIVAAQVLISYLAVISLYFSAQRLFDRRLAGIWVIILFMAFFMISFWNFWVYAESLFISLNCLSIYFLIKWIKAEISWQSILLGGFLILWTILTKPTGVAFFAALCVVGIYYIFKKADNTIKKIALYSLISIGFLGMLNEMLSTFGFVNDYKSGEIVFNIHKQSHKEYADWLIVVPPVDLYIPNPIFPPLIQLVALMVGNFFYTIKLFSLKFFFFISGIRPYYSVWHNLYNLAILLPTYFLFGYSIIKKAIPIQLICFSLTFVAVTILSTTILTIDWSGRFLLPMLPVIFLVAAGGMTVGSFSYFGISTDTR